MLSWQEGNPQQELDPVSDPGVHGTNSGESGANFETPGADTFGAIPSRPRDNARVLGAKSEVLGAKIVAPGAKSEALGAKAESLGADPGRGQEGNAQGSSPVQHVHGSLGHQAAAGMQRCKLR